MKRISIGVMINTMWKCRNCAHEQEPVENEEWPLHCGKVMEMVNYRRLVGIRAERSRKEKR